MPLLAKKFYAVEEVPEQQNVKFSQQHYDGLQCALLEKKLKSYMKKNKQANALIFSKSLECTNEGRSAINLRTKKLCQCKQWFLHKRGFITTSMVKSVYTRQLSTKKHATDILRLVKSLTSNKSSQPINLKHTTELKHKSIIN